MTAGVRFIYLTTFRIFERVVLQIQYLIVSRNACITSSHAAVFLHGRSSKAAYPLHILDYARLLRILSALRDPFVRNVPPSQTPAGIVHKESIVPRRQMLSAAQRATLLSIPTDDVCSSPRGAQEGINRTSPIPAQDAADTMWSPGRATRGQIVECRSIRARPADVEDRASPGHWERERITGSPHTHSATLVERQSRFTMLGQVPGKDTISVVTALSTQIRQRPSALRRSVTWDRGMELAQHKRWTLDTPVSVYFVTHKARGSGARMQRRVACGGSIC